MLKIKNLEVYIEKKKIIDNLNFNMKKGEVHVIMGPNGSGKTSLALAIMGSPKYKVSGSIIFNRKNLIKLNPTERAKLGIFLCFQQPFEIQGLNFSHFLYNISPKKNVLEFNQELDKALKLINKDKAFVERDLNIGFSGGEKKKAEILQMLMLKPKLAIMDEIDSGLDIDALKLISSVINKLHKKGMSVILITHNPRILRYVTPKKIHIMKSGKIIKSGGKELLTQIERSGYE